MGIYAFTSRPLTPGPQSVAALRNLKQAFPLFTGRATEALTLFQSHNKGEAGRGHSQGAGLWAFRTGRHRKAATTHHQAQQVPASPLITNIPKLTKGRHKIIDATGIHRHLDLTTANILHYLLHVGGFLFVFLWFFC